MSKYSALYNKKIMRSFKFLLIVSTLFFTSCNTADEVKPIESNKTQNRIADYQLLVVNEGNFGSGNASLSKIGVSDSTLTVENDAFYSLNNEYLGNVGQSITKVNEELWVVINNSQKIVICDLELNKVGELTGFNSPRYIAVYEDKVYVSDLYENALYVVSISKREITKKIITDSWNEELLVIKDKLWVTNSDKNTVSVYSTTADTLIKEIKVTKEPLAIKQDSEDHVWVLCNGGLLNQEEDAYLYKLDSESLSKLDSFDLSNFNGLPTRLEIYKNKVYILATDLYSLESTTFNSIISGSSHNFYSFKITDDEVYLTDAKDYVRQGQLIRYELDSYSVKDSVLLDIIPGYIYAN